MQLERRFSVYAPKSAKLTPYRKKQIVRRWREFERLRRNATYADFSSEEQRKKVVKEFKKAYPKRDYKFAKVSKRGLWQPKEERQISQTVGELKYDKDTGVYGVRVRKRTKNKMIAEEFRYIASSDVYGGMKEKLRGSFDRINGQLKKGQRIRFIIGKNRSKRTFSNFDQMFDYLDNYALTDVARASFLNALLLEVVSKGTPRVRYVQGKGKRSRRIEDKYTRQHNVFRVSDMHEVNYDDYVAAQEELGDDEYGEDDE